MHQIAYVCSLIQLFNLARFLDGTEGNDSLNQFDGGIVLGSGGTNAGQFLQSYHVVKAVRRNKMNFSSLRDGFSDHLIQLFKWKTSVYADLGA